MRLILFCYSQDFSNPNALKIDKLADQSKIFDVFCEECRTQIFTGQSDQTVIDQPTFFDLFKAMFFADLRQGVSAPEPLLFCGCDKAQRIFKMPPHLRIISFSLAPNAPASNSAIITLVQ